MKKFLLFLRCLFGSRSHQDIWLFLLVLCFHHLALLFFFSNIYGSVGEIQIDLDTRDVDVVTKIIVTGILYGGFLAGLGYFISSKYQHLVPLHEKNRTHP